MKVLETIRKNKPLILSITNSVTVNDVANAILAVGGSPVMSNEALEMADLVAHCSGVNLNMGTLNKSQFKLMLTAGKWARKFGKPVVFDPVGCGASEFRTKHTVKIVKKVHPAVIKGNMSEIKALAGGFGLNQKTGITRGVDVNPYDVICEENLKSATVFVNQLAAQLECVVAVTGAIDLVSDGKHCFIIRNGHELMEKVCGTGCVISGILPCFICEAKTLEETAKLTADCISMMGLAGEIAVNNLNAGGEKARTGGNLTLRQKIIDNLFLLDDEKLSEVQKIELR